MYNPLVSIIIPVYNGVNYLRESINSALNQTYKNIEVIVVNDGSTDNGETEDLILKYNDKVKYINKENGGSSSALNAGVKKMKGEWFSWLSHDDLYYPSKIEEQIKLLRIMIEEKNGIDLTKQVIYTNSEMIDKDGKLLFILKNRDVKDLTNIEIMVEALKTIKLSGCSFLLNRQCFDDIGGFREDLKLINDYEYWYRLLYNGYFFNYIPKILVKGRLHNAQVSNTIGYSKDNWEQEEFWETVIEYINNSSTTKRSKYLYKAGKYAMLNGRFSNGQKAFKYARSISLKYKFIIPFTSFYIRKYYYFREIAKKIYFKVKILNK